MAYASFTDIERRWVAQQAGVPLRGLEYLNGIPVFQSRTYRHSKMPDCEFTIDPHSVVVHQGARRKVVGPGHDSPEYHEFERQHRPVRVRS